MIRKACRLMSFLIAGIAPACLFGVPPAALSQTYPVKPITLYCGFSAGATTDVTARALASGAEKILGVPVVIEKRDGGGSTVCAAVVASKKPDGYNLGVISSSALTIRPYFAKMAFDPLKDFTLLMAYSEYIGGLCVLAESPLKTIDDFIAYAKAHPGLSYGSPGSYGGHHLSIELFADCKGLKFKHVPFKGGAPDTGSAERGSATSALTGIKRALSWTSKKRKGGKSSWNWSGRQMWSLIISGPESWRG